MSADCCDEETAEQLAAVRARRKTLYIVLGINLLMFVGELAAGLIWNSQALIADSADNLGDSLVYIMSLLVVARGIRWRAGAAFVKGSIQMAFGIALVISILASLLGEPQPVGLAMMLVASVALGGNLACLLLLLKHRGEDVNMRSVWLCSRNDVIANLGVIVSGALVMALDSFWPDIIVASIVAAIFLQTAGRVWLDALHSWRGEHS